MFALFRFFFAVLQFPFGYEPVRAVLRGQLLVLLFPVVFSVDIRKLNGVL